MKKCDTDVVLNPPDISPIRGSLKHQITPQRPRRKTSRKDQGADVHSSCSTPNRLQSSLQSNSYNSPSDSFPYSQEHRPDVYWDYTSPKLPKGAKKKDLEITVEEFLKNLTQLQAPQCNTQSSRYIRLLEEWMTKQITPICVKQPRRNVRRDNKRRPRQVIQEMKEFMESIQKSKDDAVAESNQKECTDKIDTPKANTSNLPNLSLDKKSFLEGDSTENDSSDDLWGEVDNSFIVKATQQLEVCSNVNFLDKNSEIVSTIPETVSSSKEPSQAFCEMGLGAEINFNNKVVDFDLHAQILLTQIVNCEWDSASDCEDWDNGFIEEDEALSLIPDEVLCGADPEISQKDDKTDQSTVTNTDKVQNLEDAQSVKVSSNAKILDLRNKSEEISFGCSESDRGTGKASNLSEVELFNDFEDESFGDDEAILCKPEVLTWIDEVESKLSQSQQCTPEEIEKKKDEAIQRRKNKK